MLKQWALELTDTAALSGATSKAINLHLADSAGAFFAGIGTFEGTALARYFTAECPSRARLTAAVASIIRHTESDDIHVASCVTPGSAVVPVALAFAAADDGTDRVERAVAAGYAIGLRLGMAIGGAAALETGIWPTYFAVPMMTAATASVCLGLDAEQTASAIALAAGGAGGRVGRAPAAPSGRWLVFGEAVAKGCNATMAAAAGFHGDPALVSPDWLAAMAPGVRVQPDALSAGSISDAVVAVSFKPFVAARQTINAVHAFRSLLVREGVAADTIERVEVGVPTINAAMVGRPAKPGDRLSTISNMAIQIAAAAIRPALLYDVERQGVPDAEIAAFAQRVTVAADPSLDRLLPDVWAGRVRVVVSGGRSIEETCESVPEDHSDTAEAVIREKLDQMVPQPHRNLCLAQMDGDDPARRRDLWDAMQEALRVV